MLITETGSILVGDKINHPSDISINKFLEDLIEDDETVKERTALVNSETGATMSYRELNEKANKVARVLLSKIKDDNINPNSDGDYIVALRYQPIINHVFKCDSRFVPSEQLIVTILAIFKAGLAYVPLAPNWPEGRVKHVIEDAAPIFIITNQGLNPCR